MPSTYSPSLKIELIGNGEQSGTWGQTTNNNMGTLIEQAIAGVETITLTGDKVLTSFNGLSDEARNAVLVFGGSLASPANVIAPAVQKTYIITNNAGANVTIKTSTGNGVVIGNGLSSLIYCDGNDFYTAVNVNNVIGDLSVSGNVTVSGGFVGVGNSNVSTASGNLTLTSNSSIIDMSTNTGAFIPPTGTTGQRPSNLALGMSRWNTSIGAYEVWTGTAWQIVASSTYNVSALVVAGGGGGSSGGGGAGGLISTASFVVTPTTAYTITVGAGGAENAIGSNSAALGFNMIGGGYGGNYNQAGAAGGSGGGGGWGGAPPPGGAGTSGQGNSGGNGSGGNGQAATPGGGGGGAGASGATASADNAGNGGIGIQSSITGTNLYYAGGGGGGNYTGPGGGGTGVGGSGGGGNGGYTSASAGTPNTGGGGGGSGKNTNGGSFPAGAGGSGVVIISYANPTQRGTGGAVTNYTAGNTTYWVHTFTTSGTFTA